MLSRVFRPKSILLSLTLGASLLGAACGSPESGGSSALSEDVGTVELSLSVGDAIELHTIGFRVFGNGFEKSGSADVERSNKVRLTIGGIPAGQGYTVELSASDVNDSTISCLGSAPFDIEAGKHSVATVHLQCRLPRDNGTVIVNGALNVCPLIDELSILPSETSVGGSVKLTSSASDSDQAPSTLAYLWGATGGKLSGAETDSATFTCTDVGTFTVSLTVDDGDCDDTLVDTVICSPPADDTNGECPADLLVALAAAPLQSSTVGTVDLSATVKEIDGNAPPVLWSATGGSFADPTSAATEYFCTEAGEQTITVVVGTEPCVERASVQVTCTEMSCGDETMEPGKPCENPLPIVHPFAPFMTHLITTKELPPAPPSTRTRPDGLLATDVRTVSFSLPIQGTTEEAELLVTPEVSEQVLTYLLSQIRGVAFDARLHKDLLPFLNGKPELASGRAEVQLPLILSKSGDPILFSLPDGWEWVRPWVIGWQPAPGSGEPKDGDGDIGVSTEALTGSWSTLRGVLNCQAPGEVAVALPFVEVTVAGQTTHTDASGAFSVSGTFTEVDRVDVRYHGDVTTSTSSGSVTSPMTVMNDFHNARGEVFDVPTGTTSGSVLDVGVLTSSSLDCELFELGVEALGSYQAFLESPPPAGGFRIKRWEGVDVGTPYAFYDYVVIATNFRSFASWREGRRSTIFHEFGHTVRHAADGDAAHWNWDNFRWAYARNHDGTEVFNEQYAFNEGWAQYWECTRSGAESPCPSIPADAPSIAFLDWNELRIGRRLLSMSAQPGFDHATMVGLLIDHRGAIHTFRDFEVRYCAAATSANAFCSGGAPTRTKSSCPPGYVDDGATCRLPNILAKPSYGRGVGTLPTGCGSDEYDAGLCYDPCPAGFDGVGPLCWEQCPSDYHDDGAFCRRDAWIFGSDNSSCDFWDQCGLTFDAGCSVCPAGFHNDGCTCRRDAHIFAKDVVGRGVGAIPTQCSGGREYDAGLCYIPCSAGYDGVGPVCWGTCPDDYDDHGATCYREPSILVKY